MRLMGEGTTFRRSLRVETRDDSLSPFGGVVLLREFEWGAPDSWSRSRESRG